MNRDKLDWKPEQVITALGAIGVTLQVEGGKLIANPKGVVTPTLAQAIRAHKEELVRLLAPPASDAPAETDADVADETAADSAPSAQVTADDGDSHRAHDGDSHQAHDGDRADSRPASPDDIVAVHLPVSPPPDAESEVVRLGAPSMVRFARRVGFHVSLDASRGTVVLAAPATVWGDHPAPVEWIETHTGRIAQALREEELGGCRWCGRTDVALDADRLCDSKCRALAEWIGWDLTQGDKANG